MTQLSFLLDENVDPRLAHALRRHAPAIGVSRVGEQGAPGLGTPDPEILLWCQETASSLVTRNRASMPAHLTALLAAGGHVPGIFVLDPDISLGEAAAELFLIWSASEAEEYAGQLTYVPLRA